MEPGKLPSSYPQTSSWLLALLGILGFVWLRSKVKTPFRQIADSKYRHDYTNYDANKFSNNIGSKIDIANPDRPSSPPQCRYPDKKTKRWYKRWKPYFFLVNLVTFVAVLWYACITRSVWKEMRKQTTTSQMQLEATERPWIKQQIVITSDLTFDEKGDAHITVVGGTKNVGHSVANSVRIFAWLVASPGDNYFTEPIERDKALCDQVASNPIEFGKHGYMLFPGDDGNDAPEGLATNKAQIERARLPYEGKPGKNAMFFLVGCVDYGYFGLPTHHQTRFVYDLMCINPKEPNHLSAIEIGKTWTVQTLALVPHSFGGQYAY